MACDLSDLATMELVVDAAINELGGLDIVVNTVGGALPRPLLETTVEAVQDAFHFNVSED